MKTTFKMVEALDIWPPDHRCCRYLDLHSSVSLLEYTQDIRLPLYRYNLVASLASIVPDNSYGPRQLQGRGVRRSAPCPHTATPRRPPLGSQPPMILSLAPSSHPHMTVTQIRSIINSYVIQCGSSFCDFTAAARRNPVWGYASHRFPFSTFRGFSSKHSLLKIENSGNIILLATRNSRVFRRPWTIRTRRLVLTTTQTGRLASLIDISSQQIRRR